MNFAVAIHRGKQSFTGQAPNFDKPSDVIPGQNPESSGIPIKYDKSFNAEGRRVNHKSSTPAGRIPVNGIV